MNLTEVPESRENFPTLTPSVYLPTLLLTLSLLFLAISRVKIVNLRKKIPLPGTKLIPLEEIYRIKDILSQLALICEADRVTLGMFHNGVIGIRGSHYDKMCVLAGYCAPGIKPLPEINKDIKAEVLIPELTPLFNNGGELKLIRENASEDCSLYLKKRDIERMWNRTLYCGNIKTAVLSFHWCNKADEFPLPEVDSLGDKKMGELIRELEVIMRTTRAY